MDENTSNDDEIICEETLYRDALYNILDIIEYHGVNEPTPKEKLYEVTKCITNLDILMQIYENKHLFK